MIHGVLFLPGHARATENMAMVSGHLSGLSLSLSRMLILPGLGVFWTGAAPGSSLAEVGDPSESCRLSGAMEGVVTNRPELSRASGDRMFPLGLTDAQWLLLGIRDHGPAFLARVHGEYALAAVDRDRGMAVLASDPSGIGRIYWHLGQGMLSFSTGARELSSMPWVPTGVDPAAVSRGLFLFQPGPRTFHRGLSRSTAGGVRVFSLSGPEGPPEGEAPDDPESGWRGDFGEEDPEILLSRAILRRLPVSGRVALPADGSWDTALLAVLARKLCPLPLTCFSMGFGSAGPDRDARTWARDLGLTHREIHLDLKDLAAQFPAYVAGLEEPAPSPAGLAAFAAFSRIKALEDPSVLFCPSWERSLAAEREAPFSPGWPLFLSSAFSRWKSVGARFMPAAFFPTMADSGGELPWTDTVDRAMDRLGRVLGPGPGVLWAAALDPTGQERRTSRRDACLGQGLASARAAGLAIRFPFEDIGAMQGVLSGRCTDQDKEKAFKDLARRLLPRDMGEVPRGPGACFRLPVEELLSHMERAGFLEPLQSGRGSLVSQGFLDPDRARAAVTEGLARGGREGALLYWMAVLDQWIGSLAGKA